MVAWLKRFQEPGPAGRPASSRKASWPDSPPCRPRCSTVRMGGRKGTNEVSTDGLTANLVFFCCDRGICLVLPLTYFYLPKSARAYLFPQSAAPLVLTPFIRNQDGRGRRDPRRGARALRAAPRAGSAYTIYNVI